ncbi:YfiT family bacillithiol transferase [Winogradskyella sp. 3972H.M.0a.05]|uniref:YfiT family bacillithiol transferase n=1 Tax=Winogradskyella sp. 3972H.M.0a.05 TaxID=2950277 RepID=UPI003390C11E
MTASELQQLKYPIGEFEKPEVISTTNIEKWISDIEQFPQRIKDTTAGLTTEQLNWKYRPDGWTIKQVVHHCADSHINSIIRFKLALTEDSPTIRPYFEDRWATLIDCNDDDLSDTLSLLTGLHAKLSKLLRNLSDTDLKREFIHPEYGKRYSLEETIGVYAWHSNHHLAHVKQALDHKGAFN